MKKAVQIIDEAPGAEEPKALPFHTTTLGEQGARLPLGILEGGIFYRDFEVRRFTMREENKIGEFRALEKGLTAGRFISYVLSVMCTKIGPYDFDTMKESAKLAAISKMALNDVLYVYVWIRLKAMGEELVMPLTCPICRFEFRVAGDLREVDVRALLAEQEADANLSFDYSLRDGITVRGKEYKVATCHQLPWFVMDDRSLAGENSYNLALRDDVFLRTAIQALDGEPIALTNGDLDNLSKYDKEGLMQAIDEAMPGAALKLDTACPKCATPLYPAIDWTYDSFFKRFSRSPRGRS